MESTVRNIILSFPFLCICLQNIRKKEWYFALIMTVLSIALPSVTAAPATVDLTLFAAGAGARITGATRGAAVGRDVAIIGDHNGDGFNDYMVASYNRGYIVVIVMKRNTTYTDMKITDIVSDQYYRVIRGPSVSNIGHAIDGIGDINGDFLDDVLIGCSRGQVPGRSEAGYAVVIFGTTGPFTDVTVTAAWPSTSIGFMILGPALASGFTSLPRTARGLGDVNGDGVNDFAVTAYFYAGDTAMVQPGMTWIIHGQKSFAYKTIDTSPANFSGNGVIYTGAANYDYLGSSIAPAGDFNGDGIADFLIGALGADPTVNGSVRIDAGVVYLIFGSNITLTSTDLAAFATGRIGVRFLGAGVSDQLGFSVASVGDINDDGVDDIAIGARSFDLPSRRNCGVVYIIYGSKEEYVADVDLLGFADFAKGFAVYGHAAEALLTNAAPAGDMDGDGVNDFLVGGVNSNSRAHIIYGQKSMRTAHVDTFSDSVMSFTYNDGAMLGDGVHGGKDIDGDGVPDILLGGYNAAVTPEGGGTTVNQAGAMWMLPGPFVLPSDAPSALPTASPTPQEPTLAPTSAPTAAPTAGPTVDPTSSPTCTPTSLPTAGPSADPTARPTIVATVAPTVDPSVKPSAHPTSGPTVLPTMSPSVISTMHPSTVPTMDPTLIPSSVPSFRPTFSVNDDNKLTVTVNQVRSTRVLFGNIYIS